ncbi:MAG: Gldg family protein [Clostridia bacterium]
MKKINKRRLKYGANNTVLIVGAIVIFILLNLLASAFSEKFPATRVDLTDKGLFKIGNTTKSVLADLDDSGDDVTVYYLKNEADEITYIKEVLLKYLAASKNLKYEVKYYVKDPGFTKRYGDVGSLTEGSLIIDDTTTGRYRIIRYEDMFEYSTNSMTQKQTISAANLESKLTNALAYCISRDEVSVCFTTGHGEASPDEMGGVLQEENITAQLFNLKTDEVPDDCGILFIISPIYDFTADEIDRLDNYLDRGGNVQIAIEPAVSLPRLESYLGEWGVTLEDNNVVEGDPNYMRYDQQTGMYWVYPQVVKSDITEDIIDRNLTVMSTLCRSINVADDPKGEITHSTIFYTTKDGVSSDIETAETKEGSFDLCVKLEKTVGENYDKTAKLIVGGSASFWGVTNYSNIVDLTGLLSESGIGNNSFFVGSVYDMMELEGTKLTIESKSLSTTRLVMTDSQENVYRIIFCYALPIVIVLAGIIIWLRRRHL